MQRRREENQRRREEEEAEEKRKEEEEAARKAEEERLQREAEEAAEAERRQKVKEGKKRKAEEEKAGKAKKTKVADSSQGPSSEQLRAARLRRFSRTSNASTRASPTETLPEPVPLLEYYISKVSKSWVGRQTVNKQQSQSWVGRQSMDWIYMVLLDWTSDKREQQVQSQELTQNQIGEGNKITSLGYKDLVESPSRVQSQNVGTGGDPSDDEYPGPDDGDDDSSDDDPEPSGDETPKEQEACERCRRLERVEACVPQKGKNTKACQPCHDNKQQCTWSGAVAVPIRRMTNLEEDLQALKEGFVDMAQGQHEILELVRESAGTPDQCLQALERRFANLEGTLVHLMKKALGVDTTPPARYIG
ncbi:hypothetical protein EV360DRAFT_74509 [Lentinula raphanica]|nr:hypothetical protein EV360DRAFT_74509 [Lentinula raphanica]